MKEIKQNKNSSVIRFIALLSAFVVLVFAMSISSFAYTDNSLNHIDFTDQPVTVLNNPTANASNYSASVFAFKEYSTSHSFSSNKDNVFAFCFLNSSNNFCCYLASTNSSFTIYDITLSGNNYNKYSSSTVQLNNNTHLYYVPYIDNINYASISNISIPRFANLNAGLNAVRDWIDNPPVIVTPHQLTLSVPAGNALYIDVTGVTTVRASLSMTSEVAHPQSWRSNQYYGFASSYPSSISGNPSGSTVIPWSGFGDKTILNRYKTFSWSLTSVGGSNYLFICNPYASIDEYDQSFNPTIYITVQEAVGYKYYQLTGGISEDGTIGQQSDGTTATGSYNDQSESWETINDQTGQPWTPSEGGGNIITQNSINSWLQTISTQIGNFFSGAIGAVTTLVSAGSDFIHQLSSLYSWLPAPVYAVLTSALILVITIGVIKVFI